MCVMWFQIATLPQTAVVNSANHVKLKGKEHWHTIFGTCVVSFTQLVDDSATFVLLQRLTSVQWLPLMMCLFFLCLLNYLVDKCQFCGISHAGNTIPRDMLVWQAT